jgi:DNA helicase II / ATP-dependent DNA helicase PcrA
LEGLQEHAQASGQSLWGAACGGQSAGGAKTLSSIAQFVGVIEMMRMATRDMTLPDMMAHLIEASGLLAHFGKEKDGSERVDNLKELVTAADGFMRESGGVLSTAGDDGTASTDALTDFLTHAALEAGDTQAAEGRPAVQLMTVHAAKGLEFDVVFITGLEEGLFPHDNSLKDDDGVQEERRLMYVAITRARKKLYLTHCQTRMMYGQTRYNIASRFLDEVPNELIQWLSPKPKDTSVTSMGYTATKPMSSYNTPAAAPAAAPSKHRVGQSVHHAKFGSGVIVNMEGGGNDARVQVNFRDAGLKWLALAYAKLDI